MNQPVKDPKQAEQQRLNRRTGFILLSVVLIFFVGIVVRKVFEPEIFNLVR